MKTNITIYVEGGGDTATLKGQCRRAFSAFLEKAGFAGKMPKIVARGSRNAAYESYCIAIKQGNEALLLIDSEAPVQNISGNPSQWNPWEHLKIRDTWKRPDEASNADCHLMVQVMETWFFADVAVLERYFGNGFNAKSLPNRPNIEKISKSEVENALDASTKMTKKKGYSKGRDSFDILASIDPAKVAQKSPWANRFISVLSERIENRG